MTAYLQPGDHIHLCVPISSGHHTKASADAEGKGQADALTAVCNQHGVMVSTWSGHTQLSHPVVSIVFRAPQGEEQ